jgi:hypothetical protein
MSQASSGKYINFNILRNFPVIIGAITGGKINNKSGHFKEKVIHVGITFWKHSPFMKEKITYKMIL